ncbi:MAG: hypothetical protein U0176_20720 [Bacteroidia bacterium]
MRKNIARLLNSRDTSNQALAMELMKAGGVPLEAFIDVYHVLFPLWENSPSENQERSQNAIAALSQSFPARIIDFVLKYLETLDIKPNPRHGVFRGSEFFELLIEEGVADLDRLVECWKVSDAYLNFTDLGSFLLGHSEEIDLNIFIDSRLQGLLLHNATIGRLFQSEHPSFNKRAFAAQFIDGKVLDLSMTGVDSLPEIYLEFPDIETIVLHGTRINHLPDEFLRRLREIRCSHRRMLLFEHAIALTPDQGCYLARKLRLKKARLDLDGRQYANALSKLKTLEGLIIGPDFSEEETAKFWEFYFEAAFESGNDQFAKEVLTKAFLQLPKNHSPLNWKGWNQKLLRIVLNDDDLAGWQVVIANTNQLANPSFLPIFNLNNIEFWNYAFHFTVSKDRPEDVRRLIDLALQNFDDSYFSRFPWLLYFRNLRKRGDSKEIIWALSRCASAIAKFYQRRTWYYPDVGELSCIWIEAYLNEGEASKAEIFCSSMISYFHRLAEGRLNSQYSDFYYAQHYAVDAYRYLVQIHSETRPICAQYYAGLAQKHQNPKRGHKPLVDQILLDVNHDYNPDFWSDVERPKAVEKLARLNKDEWKMLKIRWPQLTLAGKRNLADSLRSIEKGSSIVLLTSMLTDSDPTVGAAVVMAFLSSTTAESRFSILLGPLSAPLPDDGS